MKETMYSPTTSDFTGSSLRLQAKVLSFMRKNEASGWKQTKLCRAFLLHMGLDDKDESLQSIFDDLVSFLERKQKVYKKCNHKGIYSVYLSDNEPLPDMACKDLASSPSPNQNHDHDGSHTSTTHYDQDDSKDAMVVPISPAEEESSAAAPISIGTPMRPPLEITAHIKHAASRQEQLPGRSLEAQDEEKGNDKGNSVAADGDDDYEDKIATASFLSRQAVCSLLLVCLIVAVLLIVMLTKKFDNDSPTLALPVLEDPWIQYGQMLEGLNEDAYFGISVALSSNGKILAVGAPGQGSNPYLGRKLGQVSVFFLDDTTSDTRWLLMGNVLWGEVSYERFGASVAISGDGTTLVVGAPATQNQDGLTVGRVYGYEYSMTQSGWLAAGQVLRGEEGGNDQFGRSVALSRDGNMLVASGVGRSSDTSGDKSSGHVRVFQLLDSSTSANERQVDWRQVGQTMVGKATWDNFGRSLALSTNGLILAAGAPGNADNGFDAGHVQVFKFDVTTERWQGFGLNNILQGEASSDFGSAVALSSDGSILAVGAPYDESGSASFGQVQVYRYDVRSKQWNQLGQTIDGMNANDRFGYAVALSADGMILAAGASLNDSNGISAGHVRLFRYNQVAQAWQPYGQAIEGRSQGDFFGVPLDLSADGSIVAAGGLLTDGNETNAGNVRSFVYNSGP